MSQSTQSLSQFHTYGPSIQLICLHLQFLFVHSQYSIDPVPVGLSLLFYCEFIFCSYKPIQYLCFHFHLFVLIITHIFFSFNVFTCSYPFLWVFLCSINKIRTSVTLDMSVCKDDRLLKKGVCTNCRGCQCWNQPTYFSLKRNHNGYKTQWIYIIATNIFKNNYASDSS